MLLRPRVLIIDDRLTSRRLAMMLSQRIGLDPTAVSTQMEALRELESGKWFSVVLIDLDIPHDPEALECLKSLLRHRKQRGINLPIIAVTAYASQTDRAMCLNEGADDYLSKPYTMAQFSDKVLSWVAEFRIDQNRNVG
ncbi:MAG TPA: response regulator [Candidatus Obscuribacterales bacterium]